MVFSIFAPYARIVSAAPGLTLAMIVKPLAGVAGIMEPYRPLTTSSSFRGRARAIGLMSVMFMMLSLRRCAPDTATGLHTPTLAIDEIGATCGLCTFGRT